MKKSLTEDEIKYVLFHNQKILQDNEKRVFKLYRTLDEVDDIIRSVSMPGIQKEKVGGRNNTINDLTNVLFRYKELLEESEMEVRIGLLKLSEEREMINRVQVCYNALPSEEYNILCKLYEEKQLYKEVEKESKLNHRQFEKIRKRGLKRIKDLYESNLTNLEIIHLKQIKYQQLSLKNSD